MLAVAFVVIEAPARYLGYDAAWAAVWGRQIADGNLPVYQTEFAPTPHPLANFVSAVVSVFGSPEAVLPWLSIGALAASAVLVGQAASYSFGPIAGVMAGAILITRPRFLEATAYSSTDVWFIALLGLALCLHRGERRWLPALVALSVAGLLRPEAWVLAGSYALVATRGLDRRERFLALAVALSAPTVWAVGDLIATGDALFSLHGTSALAAQLDRPRSTTTAVLNLPGYLRDLLGTVPTALGLAGALVGIRLLYARSLPYVAVAGLGLAMFIALGLFGLPVLDRYLLVPAIVVSVFGGVALGGWRCLPRHAPTRRIWAGLAALGLVGLALSAWHGVRLVSDRSAMLQARGRVQDDLVRILESEPVRRSLARCPSLTLPDYRGKPTALLATGRSASLSIGATRRRGVVLTYASKGAYQAFGIPTSRFGAPPRTGGVVAQNRSWRAVARCG